MDLPFLSTRNLLAAMLAGTIATNAVVAEQIRLGPDRDWFATLNASSLRPGDEVVLAAGVYSDRRKLTLGHRGERDKPVIIRAADGAKVVFRRPDARQNSFNLVGAQYLHLRGIEITGGSAGIRISADADRRHQPQGIVLEGLHIHHIGGVAVTCNHAGSRYANMEFRGNHIHHTGGHGEAFYLGCNNDAEGKTPGYIFNSIVERNYIHDLNGESISQGDGIEIKDGSFGNTIRDNVIHDTKFPGIIVYGSDGKVPNVIERNAVWNTGDNGIQAAAEAVIRNNIVFDTGGDAIHLRSHQSAVAGGVQVLHNTLVQRAPDATGIRAQRPAGGFSKPVVIANNAIYAARALRFEGDPSLTISGNVGAGSPLIGTLPEAIWDAGGELALDLDSHYHPRPDSRLLGGADKRFSVARDFSGLPRHRKGDIGALEFRPTAPRTRIEKAFKPLPPQER